MVKYHTISGVCYLPKLASQFVNVYYSLHGRKPCYPCLLCSEFCPYKVRLNVRRLSICRTHIIWQTLSIQLIFPKPWALTQQAQRVSHCLYAPWKCFSVILLSTFVAALCSSLVSFHRVFHSRKWEDVTGREVGAVWWPGSMIMPFPVKTFLSASNVCNGALLWCRTQPAWRCSNARFIVAVTQWQNSQACRLASPVRSQLSSSRCGAEGSPTFARTGFPIKAHVRNATSLELCSNSVAVSLLSGQTLYKGIIFCFIGMWNNQYRYWQSRHLVLTVYTTFVRKVSRLTYFLL